MILASELEGLTIDELCLKLKVNCPKTARQVAETSPHITVIRHNSRLIRYVLKYVFE